MNELNEPISQPILQVENLGKTYFQYRSEVARVASWFGLPAKPAVEHCVLQGISFSINPGEAIGIVGQNGAGKSTLLKIVTGTQRPTTGSVQLFGKVGSILELGMGFNPEFTGRQNAYHSAGLMGFSKTEIESFMSEIESFAEIGDYFDQPVNTYSSGMQMRVAFSVITASRPELLIVDEALSVGDTYFQHKSFNRIRDFQKQGSSLLLVSHDASVIQSLCNRAILLEKGKVIKDDDPESVMDYYNALTAQRENSIVRTKQLENGKTQTLSGTGEATIIDIALIDEEDERVKVVNVGQSVCLRIVIQAQMELPELVVGYLIKDRLGQPIFGTNTYYLNNTLLKVEANEEIKLDLKFSINLGVGHYSIAVAIHADHSHVSKNYEWRDLALLFEVINTDKDKFIGVGWMPPTMEYHR